MKKEIHIISAGEVLIDFIGHDLNMPIKSTKDYHRFLGGSPTNVAVNAARLGLNAVLVATCGADGLGDYIISKLQKNNVNTNYVRRSETEPTSVVFVSKSTGTPEFIAYREADSQIYEAQIPQDLLQKAAIFHTTCFALSRNPGRETILNAAVNAKSLGLQTSIDINFSDKIWPDRYEAKQVLGQYLKTNPLVKLSEDDCYRLFEVAKTEDFIFDFFHNLGADTICLTKGKNGVSLSDKKTGVQYHNALKVAEIKDTTGAGDAFWTGFLYAQLFKKDFGKTIEIAQKLAILKLQNIGRLPESIDLQQYLNTDN